MPRWFGQDQAPTPVLDALLWGPAWALADIYALIAFARLQTRISTATGGWLDLIAYDFFGSLVQRRPGQTDAFFRAYILASIFRERATRAGIIKVVQDLTGRAPKVSENRRPFDGNAYAAFGGYSVGRAYTANRPFEVFVEAYRGVPGSIYAATPDADIYAAIDQVRAAGITVWVRILDNPLPAFRLGFTANVFSRRSLVFPTFASMPQASATRFQASLNPTFAAKFNIFSMPASGDFAVVFGWSDETANNVVALTIIGSTGHLMFSVTTGGVLLVNLDLGIVLSGNTYAFAGRLQTNDAAACLAAGSVLTDTSVALPNPTALDIGNFLGGTLLVGTVMDLRGYDAAYSNADLLTLAASL